MGSTSRYSFFEKKALLSHFKEEEEFEDYHRFGVDLSTSKFYSSKIISPVYGDDAYKEKIKKLYLK